jgi:NADH dehydrogenase
MDMNEQYVVLGAGYAGTGAVQRLESELNSTSNLTWIAPEPDHRVLHESHRCIRNPSVKEQITVPVEDLKSRETAFVQAAATEIDPDERLVYLDDGETIEYDYLLVCIGSQTAFFGIDGLADHAHTLKCPDDALAIHEEINTAAQEATTDNPASIVIGGAGLSGIQSAGECAALRDEYNLPIEIRLVEGLDSVLPNGDLELQRAIKKRLENAGVEILTGEFIGEVDENTIYIGESKEVNYDVLVWTGGITGQDAVRETDIEKDERSHRLNTDQSFQTDNERIFAIGDCALIDQPNEDPAPPTAQAAWQAAEVAGSNLARAGRGAPLETWTFENKGTVVSIGKVAVAHNVTVLGLNVPVSTFGGPVAAALKKAIAVRWLNRVAGPKAAIAAWPDM